MTMYCRENNTTKLQWSYSAYVQHNSDIYHSTFYFLLVKMQAVGHNVPYGLHPVNPLL